MSETKPIDEGGPAFPLQAHVTVFGMSLRDYFAAKAMQAEMITTFSDATPEAAAAFENGMRRHGHTPEQHLAVNAYRIADAMIAQRKVGAR